MLLLLLLLSRLLVLGLLTLSCRVHVRMASVLAPLLSSLCTTLLLVLVRPVQ